jgi:hypothetical protein
MKTFLFFRVVTFEDPEDAKKVEQYNGMDMEKGTKIELVSV